MRAHVDAGAAGRLGVAADGVDVPAEGGALGDERPDQQQRDDQEQREGHAAVAVADAGRQEGRDGHAHELGRRAAPGRAASRPWRRPCMTPLSVPADVGDAHDRGDDPARGLREEVLGDVVDRLVLDHEHALRDRLEDDALPDLEAGERDDERRHADERHDRALERADRHARDERSEDRDEPVVLMRAARELELRDDHARDAADVADREVDLTDQEDEDDAVGEQRDPRHLQDDVVEVDRGEEVVGGLAEDGHDQQERHDDRAAAEVARAEVVHDPARVRRDPGRVERRRGLDEGVVL